MTRAYTYHGGSCCGMSHIQGMSGSTERVLSKVDRALAELPRDHCVEVVMTDEQIRFNPNTTRGLKERGFKVVSRFMNDNSGNYCNVLHRYPRPSGKGSGVKNSPFHKV